MHDLELALVYDKEKASLVGRLALLLRAREASEFYGSVKDDKVRKRGRRGREREKRRKKKENPGEMSFFFFFLCSKLQSREQVQAGRKRIRFFLSVLKNHLRSVFLGIGRQRKKKEEEKNFSEC